MWCRDTGKVSWAAGRVSDPEASVLITHPRGWLFRWLFRSCENTCPVLDAGLNCICVLEEDPGGKARTAAPRSPELGGQVPPCCVTSARRLRRSQPSAACCIQEAGLVLPTRRGCEE